MLEFQTLGLFSSFDRSAILKSELFGNGTTLESAEIRRFGFQTFTVLSKCYGSELAGPGPSFANKTKKFKDYMY